MQLTHSTVKTILINPLAAADACGPRSVESCNSPDERPQGRERTSNRGFPRAAYVKRTSHGAKWIKTCFVVSYTVLPVQTHRSRRLFDASS